MQKKKKWILLGLGAVALAAVVIFLALRYVPFHKLMKRPSSADIAFVNEPQAPGNAPYSLFCDFEVDSTKSTPSGLYKGIGHSGKYSAKTFGKNTFSLSLDRQVADLKLPELKSVSLSAWVYVFPTDKEPEAALVFTVTNTVGVNTCWKGVSLHGPRVPKGTWFKMSGSFNLSDVQIRPDDKIQVYFWNNSPTDILSDDFYVVFGNTAPRQGDSARWDMTKGQAFHTAFNMPPYQTAWLTQEDALKQAEIGQEDQLCSGAFLPGGLESLLVLKADGNLRLYHYCTSDKVFHEFAVTCPANLTTFLAGARVQRGPFLGKGGDQLLFRNDKGLLLAEIGSAGDPCLKGGAVTLKEIWSSAPAEINGIPAGKDVPLVTGDITGDRQAEVLLARNGGSWELLSFRNGGWFTLASGDEEKLREWDNRFCDFHITAGRFSSKTNADLLLTVFAEKNKRNYQYSLVRFSAGEKKFIPALSGAEGMNGRTFGLDTLKPSDQYFFGNFAAAGPAFFLRYNRDWRYNLKELRFNDSTFEVLSTVDFRGFELDRNPKYYESLRLVPGRFLQPGITSLLVVARNAESLPYLPDAVQIYSFQPKNKP